MAAKRTRKPARKGDRRERTILAQPGREVLPPPAGGLPASYPAFREDIKARLRTAQNIGKMRTFYLAWTDEVGNLSRPVRELDGRNLPQAVAGILWRHNTE